MKKLDRIVRSSSIHNINAPIDIIAQRLTMRSSLNMIFRAVKGINPLLIKYITSSNIKMRFKNAGRMLIQSFLKPISNDVWVFNASTIQSNAIKLLKNLRIWFVFKAQELRINIISYMQSSLKMRFKTNASVTVNSSMSGKSNMIISTSKLKDHAEKYIDGVNKWLFDSTAHIVITRYLQFVSDNTMLLSANSPRLSYGRYRLLYEMDDHSLNEYDNMELEDVDYIFFDN